MQEPSQGEVDSPHGVLPRLPARPALLPSLPIDAGNEEHVQQTTLAKEIGEAATPHRAAGASPGFKSGGLTSAHADVDLPVFQFTSAADGPGAADGGDDDQMTDGAPRDHVNTPLGEARDHNVADTGVEGGTGGIRLPSGGTMQDGLLTMLAENTSDDDDDDADDCAARDSATGGDGAGASLLLRPVAGKEGAVGGGQSAGAVPAELDTVAAEGNPVVSLAPPQPESSEDTDVTAPEAGFEGPDGEVSGPVGTKGSSPAELATGPGTTGGWITRKRITSLAEAHPPPSEGQLGDQAEEVPPVPNSVPPSVPLATESVAWPEEGVRQSTSVSTDPPHLAPSRVGLRTLERAKEMSGEKRNPSRRPGARSPSGPSGPSGAGPSASAGLSPLAKTQGAPSPDPFGANEGEPAPKTPQTARTRAAPPASAEQTPGAHKQAAQKSHRPRRLKGAEVPEGQVPDPTEAMQEVEGGSRSTQVAEPQQGPSAPSAGRRASTRGGKGAPAVDITGKGDDVAAERREDHIEGHVEGERKRKRARKGSEMKQASSAVTSSEDAAAGELREDEGRERGPRLGEMKGPGEAGGDTGAELSDQARPGIQSLGASPTLLGGIEAPFFARPQRGGTRTTPRAAGAPSVTPTLKQYSRKRKRAVPRDDDEAPADVEVVQEPVDVSTSIANTSHVVGGAAASLPGGRKGVMHAATRAGVEPMSVAMPGHQVTHTAADKSHSSPEGTVKDSEGPVHKAGRRSGRAVTREGQTQKAARRSGRATGEEVAEREATGTLEKARTAGRASLPGTEVEAGGGRKSARDKRSVPARFVSSPGAATQAGPAFLDPFPVCTACTSSLHCDCERVGLQFALQESLTITTTWCCQKRRTRRWTCSTNRKPRNPTKHA